MAGATTREEPRALFYDAVAGEAERRMLRVGLEVAAVAGDQVAFDAENGGDVDRELAVPFLAGMDEVVVDGASRRLQAAEREMDVIGFTVSGTGGGDGVVIALAAPARINRIVFGPITFPESVRSESV